MAERVNPAVIGGFVVGALLLGLAGLLVFGGGKFFRDTTEFVLFFPGSVDGLMNGSPVTFRGVRLGTVKNVNIMADAQTFHFVIPVVIELERGHMVIIRGGKVEQGQLAEDPKVIMRHLIDRGLRAQLRTRSMVTGQLEVTLGFHPDTPAEYHDPIGGRVEIPTIPSGIEQLSKTIQELPIEELVESAAATMSQIQKIVNSPEWTVLATSINETLKDTRATLASARKSLDAATAGVEEVKKQFATQMSPSGDIAEVAKSTRTFLAQAERTLRQAEDALDENSSTRRNLTEALREIADAAETVQALTDYLERHPEALLRGKRGE